MIALPSEVRRRWPVLALGVVVAVTLLATRHLLELVSWPNDLPFHHSMVDWATGRIRAGSSPTGAWYPRLSGGLDQFRSYQSLPHVLTALLGSFIGAERALHLVLWLLVGTWPIPVYVGARALGLERPAAAVAAAVAPLVRSATGYGFEPFSYLWLGNGLWSQAWGMWVAPLALGWSAAAIRDGRGYGRAVAAIALTVAFHLPTAWFVLVAIGLWACLEPRRWRQALPRAVGVGALAVLASAWVLIPFVTDRWATNASSFNGEGDFADSFGWRRVGGWLAAGDLLDAGRIPMLSAVAAIGVIVVVRRWRAPSPGDRAVAALGLLALVLFVGRDPFGPVIALLPGSSQVFLHRYVAPLQLALVWFVGIAAASIGRQVHRWWPTGALAPLVLCIVALVALAGPVRSTHRLLGEDARWMARQGRADATEGADGEELVAIARARGGGRVFAGRLHGGEAAWIGDVRGPIWLAHLPVDQVGFSLRVSALAADLEAYLDSTSVADLDAFGVRFILVRRGQQPPTGTWFVAARGDLQLWEVPGDGIVSTARLIGPALEVGRGEIAERLLPVLRAQGGSPTEVRLLDFEGRSQRGDTQASEPDAPRPGRVLRQDVDLDAGRVGAEVDFDDPGVLVVKANWSPRWRATVDGRPAPVVAVAPTWFAVPVSEGRHTVAVRHQPAGGTAGLLVLAVIAVIVAVRWSRSGDDIGWRRLLARARRAGLEALAAAAVVALVSCGTPHRLPAVDTASPPMDGSLAEVHLRQARSFATLDRVLAPDRPTVLVVAPTAASSPLLDALADAAAGDAPFSVLRIEDGSQVAAIEAVVGRRGLSTWSAVEPSTALHALELTALGGVVVLRPDGSILGRWRAPEANSDVPGLVEEVRGWASDR